MTRILRADMDATILSACGLLVALGLVLRCWSRLGQVTT
jgi:hypothetical protein